MANLWGITAGVYLALLGPQGIVELGEGIMLRAQYAMKKLAEIQGIQAPRFRSPHFSEFIVNFDGTGKTVAEINQALLAQRILGGHDLSREFPELGQSALYCVSEVHSQADMDTLIQSLRKAVRA